MTECDLTRSGLMGLKAVLLVRVHKTALNAFCSRAASLPFMQQRGDALDRFSPSLVTMIQCLTINYFPKWGTSLCCIQSRPSAQVWSKPDESTEASSLSHLQSLFFLCWILSTLDSSNVRVPQLSLLLPESYHNQHGLRGITSLFSVTSQPVIFNWLVNLSVGVPVLIGLKFWKDLWK